MSVFGVETPVCGFCLGEIFLIGPLAMVVKLDSLTIGRCTSAAGAGAGAGVGAGVGFLVVSWGGGGGRDAGVGVDALARFDGEGGTEDS